jgi:uncharacterized membrane protein YhiD involved in acid resistance
VIENLRTVNIFAPSLLEILINIFISLCCSFIISLVYRFTYKGPGYSHSFVNSIIFLSVITSLVIMIIGNNLARAFGLVGALSIIRFRTAIKDTVDIVYIFLSLTIGMASGVGYHKLAITGTIVLTIIFLIFSNDKVSFFISNQYMLQFSHFNNKEDDGLLKTLSKYCVSFEIINIRSNEIEKSFEYSYYIRVKKTKDAKQLMIELQQINDIKGLNLFFDQQSS